MALAFSAFALQTVASESDVPNLRIIDEQATSWTNNFNPWLGGLASSAYAYEPLFIFNELDATKEYPWLSTKYKISEDLKTLTIDIRSGVKWSDGKSFTAEDVVFTFNYIKENPSIDITGVGALVDKVELVESESVKFHLKEKNAFSYLNILKTKIIPKHIWSLVDKPEQEIVKQPIGTGPFTEISRFTPQVYVQCRNEHYWNEELALNCIEFPQVSSNDAALEMMSKGQTDWHNIFVPDIDRLYVKAAEGNHYWFPSGDGVRITLNFQTKNDGARKAFNNLNFRKAFSLAMDREAMRELGAYGYVELGNSATNLPSALGAWRDTKADKAWSKYDQYNLEKAKALLVEGGFMDSNGDGYVENPDGSSFEFMIQVPSGWSPMVNNATIAVEGLRAIGIKANIITPEVSAYAKNWTGGNFDATFGAGSMATSPWKFYDYTMHSRNAKGPQWWSTSMTNYVNQELDNTIEELGVTLDKTKQKALVGKIEQHFSENVVQIPLYYNAVWYSYNNSRFTGFFNEDNPVAHPGPYSQNRLLHVLHIKPRT